ATSGDYRNYFEIGGVRYSHEIDPRTGWPVSHELAQVTVLAPDCMHADAWATALLVLGPQEGPALARRLGLKALFLVRREGELVEVPVEGFRFD
ncbi:MAG: FAD:protein FMN transferase, partial [Gammaproteobacteria bacterium]